MTHEPRRRWAFFCEFLDDSDDAGPDWRLSVHHFETKGEARWERNYALEHPEYHRNVGEVFEIVEPSKEGK